MKHYPVHKAHQKDPNENLCNGKTSGSWSKVWRKVTCNRCLKARKK